ncbi:hypothetical protein V6N11_054607 [Hibiscus sabdariffa]|uniref:Uncharacterized protein n=1 Tax=Hibiscus sabdariffa TaxID=183260 RepID=A0ABR2S4J3_9ROSI
MSLAAGEYLGREWVDGVRVVSGWVPAVSKGGYRGAVRGDSGGLWGLGWETDDEHESSMNREEGKVDGKLRYMAVGKSQEY